MYKKEIERKFLVKKDKLPKVNNFKKLRLKQGYLSQQLDSLTVRVRSINDEEFLLEMKDGGRLVRNEISFKITKEEFETSYKLCGNKTITKTRYLIPSEKNDNKILELDVYDDFDFITCEFEGNSETEVESLILEDWIGEEVTFNKEYSNNYLANNKHINKKLKNEK